MPPGHSGSGGFSLSPLDGLRSSDGDAPQDAREGPHAIGLVGRAAGMATRHHRAGVPGGRGGRALAERRDVQPDLRAVRLAPVVCGSGWFDRQGPRPLASRSRRGPSRSGGFLLRTAKDAPLRVIPVRPRKTRRRKSRHETASSDGVGPFFWKLPRVAHSQRYRLDFAVPSSRRMPPGCADRAACTSGMTPRGSQELLIDLGDDLGEVARLRLVDALRQSLRKGGAAS